MLKFVVVPFILLSLTLQAQAQPNPVEAILIKQFLICEGAQKAGCKAFSLSKFSCLLYTSPSPRDRG